MPPKKTGEKKPFDAATVILVRSHPKESIQVLLVRRHEDQSFMPGVYVFPGGKLEKDDCNPDLAKLAQGSSKEDLCRQLGESDLFLSKSLGFYFAAIRETYEEVGILPGLAKQNKQTKGLESLLKTNPAKYRSQLHGGSISFKDLSIKHNLKFDFELLRPYSRWITPLDKPVRFDTIFFITKLSDNQKARHDAIELTESLWISPLAALKRHQAKDLPLMPPTFKTLLELADYNSVDNLMESLNSTQIPIILPELFNSAGNGFSIFPNDPEYSLHDYKLPFCPGDISRLIYKNGAWQAKSGPF